jgi:hypothetical protein
MKELKQYIQKILGIDLKCELIHKKELGMLPLFISETYRLYNASLFNFAFILVEKIDPTDLSILQTDKHLKLICNALDKKVVMLASEVNSLNRKRLIEKGINFIIPEKQLFLPDFLIDLKEDFRKEKNTKVGLLPSAQFIVLFRILQRNDKIKIEELSFKELATILNYTPMAISDAAKNLKLHEVCTIVGEKEKYLRFNNNIADMWNNLEQRKLLANPVIRKVYVDNINEAMNLFLCNYSALPEYTDMNPSHQKYYAIEKNKFYKLIKKNALLNQNDKEGKFCLEVWKYCPKVLANKLQNESMSVDPLSLYLSLKDNKDERTEMALEQIIENYIW